MEIQKELSWKKKIKYLKLVKVLVRGKEPMKLDDEEKPSTSASPFSFLSESEVKTFTSIFKITVI